MLQLARGPTLGVGCVFGQHDAVVRLSAAEEHVLDAFSGSKWLLHGDLLATGKCDASGQFILLKLSCIDGKNHLVLARPVALPYNLFRLGHRCHDKRSALNEPVQKLFGLNVVQVGNAVGIGPHPERLEVVRNQGRGKGHQPTGQLPTVAKILNLGEKRVSSFLQDDRHNVVVHAKPASAWVIPHALAV